MSQRAVLIGELRCDSCGSKDIFAIAPGDDEVRDMFLLARDVTVRCWCIKCWTKGAEEANV